MALMLNEFNLMEFLWDLSDKAPDGVHVVYSEIEVITLWQIGVIDTENISLKRWLAIVEPFRRADKTFLFTKETFLSLDKYRYKGELKVPFDAALINEGKYTDAGLEELFDLSITPSCGLSKPDLKKFIDDLKKKFRASDNLIEIRGSAKLVIKNLIATYPSPLHNLEMIFDRLLKTGGATKTGEKIDAEAKAHAIRDALREKSSFQMGSGKSVDPSNRLKKLEKSSKPQEIIKSAEEIRLKEIKRSRKGIRS